MGPGLAAVAISLLSLRFLHKLFPLQSLTLSFDSVWVTIFIPWFLSLIVAGALAAYSSRRLGGRLPHRIIASLFPAFWEVLRILVILVAGVSQQWGDTAEILSGVLTRIVVPSIALLLGAALFLRDSSARDAPA